MAAVEIFHIERGFADEEVIGNHHAGDGAEQAGVADEPAENVGAEIAQQFPGHHEDADDAGDEAAGAERDQARIEVGEIVRGRDDVSGDVGVEGRDE